MPKAHDFKFLEQLGARLATRREQMEMTQAIVAHKARITAQMLSRYELGLSDPPISTLLRVCEALKINPTALLVQTSVMAEK